MTENNTNKKKIKKISANVDPKLHNEFYNLIAKKYGSQYGNVQIEIENAIKTYIRYHKDGFNLLEDFGLCQVLPPRRSSKEIEEILKEQYKKEFSKSRPDIDDDAIMMRGISLKDFIISSRPYSDILINALKEGIIVKILIVSPLSDWSRNRVSIEQGNKYLEDKSYITSELYVNLRTVIETLDELVSKYKDNLKVCITEDVNYYSIILKNVVYMEGYHSADIKNIIKNYNGKENCQGGIGIPFLIYQSDSTLGELFRNSFKRDFLLYSKVEKYSLKYVLDKIKKYEKELKSE